MLHHKAYKIKQFKQNLNSYKSAGKYGSGQETIACSMCVLSLIMLYEYSSYLRIFYFFYWDIESNNGAIQEVLDELDDILTTMDEHRFRQMLRVDLVWHNKEWTRV